MHTTFQPLLLDSFHEAVRTHANEVALEWRQTHLSYAHLDVASSQVAHRLRSAGLPPGTIVALLLENPLTLITSLLGVLKAGCAFAPLTPQTCEKIRRAR